MQPKGTADKTSSSSVESECLHFCSVRSFAGRKYCSNMDTCRESFPAIVLAPHPSSGQLLRAWRPEENCFWSRLMSLMAALIAVAGVVTPLGLYETVEPAHNTQAPFNYLPDSSSFGLGTPPRSNYSFTRLCVTLLGTPLPCPFTDTVVFITYEANGTINYHHPYHYDLNVPEKLIDTFSSGMGNNTTVSNFFDIQWRQYLTTNPVNQPNTVSYNSGSTYLVATFRNMESLILNNAYQPVEGLIVDSINGGIGFRNHTVPPGFQNGVTWEEDLLFIEPETVSADTNLTIDFTMANSPNSTIIIDNLVSTDRGGFVNLNHTFPEPKVSNPQNNSGPYDRAYKAAWLTSILSSTIMLRPTTTKRPERRHLHISTLLLAGHISCRRRIHLLHTTLSQ